MGENVVLGQMGLLFELFVHAHVGEMLDIAWHLGQSLSLVLFLDFRVDSTLSSRFIELPF